MCCRTDAGWRCFFFMLQVLFVMFVSSCGQSQNPSPTETNKTNNSDRADGFDGAEDLPGLGPQESGEFAGPRGLHPPKERH